MPRSRRKPGVCSRMRRPRRRRAWRGCRGSGGLSKRRRRACTMQNDRPIEDPRLQEALALIQMICREYDLAGAIMLVSEHEAAFTYPIYTTWNCVIEDASLPLGFRFRLQTAEQG